MSPGRAAVTAIAALWAAASSSAQPPAPETYRPDDERNHEARWEGFSIFTDQDVFFPPAFDQDYTMGLEFVCQGRWVRDRKLVAPLAGLDWLSGFGGLHYELQQDRVPAGESPSQRADLLGFASHSVHFGNSGFTPAKATLGLTQPIYDDRPYANLLYLKVRRTSARGNRALVSDLSFGMLGLRLGEWVQTKIHKANGDVLPGGWPNQISDGGEPTLKYRVSPRWKLLGTMPGKPRRSLDMDLAIALEANAGYYTNVAAGGRFRVGLIRSAWWSFERNAIADVRGPGVFRSRLSPGKPFLEELYGWASGGGTAWLYNVFLQGQFCRSAITLRFDEGSVAPIKRYTGDAQVGATVRIRPGIFVTYAVQWLSSTFGGPKERTHSWGSFYFGYQK